MAIDSLVDSAVLDSALSSVADAIRAKGGTSAQLAFPAGFVSAVQAIPTVTVNEVTLTADVANANELCAAIMPGLAKYRRAVFWYKTGQSGLQNRIMGAYVYKSGDASYGGGRTRYNYGYGANDGTAKAGDTYCWIGDLPAWN